MVENINLSLKLLVNFIHFIFNLWFQIKGKILTNEVKNVILNMILLILLLYNTSISLLRIQNWDNLLLPYRLIGTNSFKVNAYFRGMNYAQVDFSLFQNHYDELMIKPISTKFDNWLTFKNWNSSISIAFIELLSAIIICIIQM